PALQLCHRWHSAASYSLEKNPEAHGEQTRAPSASVTNVPGAQRTCGMQKPSLFKKPSTQSGRSALGAVGSSTSVSHDDSSLVVTELAPLWMRAVASADVSSPSQWSSRPSRRVTHDARLALNPVKSAICRTVLVTPALLKRRVLPRPTRALSLGPIVTADGTTIWLPESGAAEPSSGIKVAINVELSPKEGPGFLKCGIEHAEARLSRRQR